MYSLETLHDGVIFHLDKEKTHRLAVISDLHLDQNFSDLARQVLIHRCNSFAKKVALENEQGFIFLLGDILDELTLQGKFPYTLDSRLIFGKLRQYLKAGIQIIIVAGNHDKGAWYSKVWQDWYRLQIGEGLVFAKWALVESGSGNIFMLHGHRWDVINRDVEVPGVKPLGDLIVENLVVPMQRDIRVGNKVYDCRKVRDVVPCYYIPAYLQLLDPTGTLNEHWEDLVHDFVKLPEILCWQRVTPGTGYLVANGISRILLNFWRQMGGGLSDIMDLIRQFEVEEGKANYMDKRCRELLVGKLDSEDKEPGWDNLPKVDVVMAGHTHDRRFKCFHAGRYVNCGSWVENISILYDKDNPGAARIHESCELPFTVAILRPGAEAKIVQIPYLSM